MYKIDRELKRIGEVIAVNQCQEQCSICGMVYRITDAQECLRNHSLVANLQEKILVFILQEPIWVFGDRGIVQSRVGLFLKSSDERFLVRFADESQNWFSRIDGIVTSWKFDLPWLSYWNGDKEYSAEVMREDIQDLLRC